MVGEISETSTNEQESAGVPRTAIDDNHGTNLLLPSRVLLPLHDAVAAVGGGRSRRMISKKKNKPIFTK